MAFAFDFMILDPCAPGLRLRPSSWPLDDFMAFMAFIAFLAYGEAFMAFIGFLCVSSKDGR